MSSKYGIDIEVSASGAVSGSRTAKRSLQEVEQAASSVASTLGKLGVSLGVAELGRQLLNVQREFDKLNAGLVSATGSAEAASAAFIALQDFASTTPYDLAQATDGFIKLVNLGLTPSEKALTSYGDTAAAMGKSLNQMIEAVADAATGEFERLKEFGIKAKNNGDTVAFTFQGVTTSVRNNSAEIESYLIQLGENKFAGTMAERMKTLDGAISNLSDTWDNLLLSVNQLGPNNAATQGVQAITQELQNLTDSLKSGELPAQIAAFGNQFETTFDDVSFMFSALDKQITETLNGWGISAQNSSNFMSDAFWQFPANIRALIQVATVEVAAFVDKASVYGQAIADALNPFADDDIGFQERMQQRLDGIESARQSTIDGYLAARNAAVQTLDEEKSKAADLRKEYEAQIAARKAAGGDRLAGFRVGADASAAGPSAEEIKKKADALKEEERAMKANAATVAKLQEQLTQASMAGGELAQRQAELSLNSYATPEQVQQVRDLAAAISDLEDRKRLADEAEQIRRQTLTGPEQMALQYQMQQQVLQDALNAKAITEQQYYETSAALNERYNDEISKQEAAANSARLQAGAQLFDGLAGIAGTFAGEQSGIYKALFAASKAFAVADAVIKIQQGIANAAALPFPANLAAMGTVAAATGSIVSTISGTQMSGFQSGGYTGNMGTSQVAGVVHGQEYVMNAEATRRIGVGNLERMSSGGSMGSVNITVENNAPGVRVDAQQLTEGDVRIIVTEELASQLPDRMTAELSNPYSDSRAVLSSSYSIQRNTVR